MSKTFLQISGAADSGDISAALCGPIGDDRDAGGLPTLTTDLTLGQRVAIREAGSFALDLRVKGFPRQRIELEVTPFTNPPRIQPKGRLPLAIALTRQRTKDARSDAQTDWLFTFRCTFSHARELVFVVGDNRGKATFNAYADSRREDLCRKRFSALSPLADGSTFVTKFDFSTDEQTHYVLSGPRTWTVWKKKSLRHDLKNLSIGDVYRYIQQVGVHSPGRIVELSFFSHAWAGGPILSDSLDHSPDSFRDEHDRDPRLKDFSASNMRENDRKNFAAAFSTKATNNIFGCYATLLYRYCAIILAKKEPADPNQRFVIKLSKDRVLHKSFSQCREELRHGLNHYYAQGLATLTGRPCWAAPPSAGSSLVQQGKRCRMVVDMKNFGPYVRTIIKAFDLEKNDDWYVKYTGKEVQ